MKKRYSGKEAAQRILCAAFALLVLVPAIAFAGGGRDKGATGAVTAEGGGRMTVGCTVPLDTLSLDVGSMYGNWGCLYYMLVYDNLMEFTKPPNYYTFTPEYGIDYDLAEDRMSYVLHLAEGAKWHDGRAVTAEDVKFTMENLWSLPAWADAEVDYAEIEVIDDHTLRVVSNLQVSGANPPPYWAWDPVVPKHIFEEAGEEIETWPNDEAIGSGPESSCGW